MKSATQHQSSSDAFYQLIENFTSRFQSSFVIMFHSSPDLIISVPQAIGYCITMKIGEMFFCSLYFAARDALHCLRRLHQVPCDRCIFFTGEYTLKCAVHPHQALTENAIHCCDFESANPLFTQQAL